MSSKYLFNSKYFPIALGLIGVTVFCVWQLLDAQKTTDPTSGWLGNLYAGVISTSVTILLTIWTVESSLALERKRKEREDKEKKIERVKSAILESISLYKNWFLVIKVNNISLHLIEVASSATEMLTVIASQIEKLDAANQRVVDLKLQIALETRDLNEKEKNYLIHWINFHKSFIDEFEEKVGRGAVKIFNEYKDYVISSSKNLVRGSGISVREMNSIVVKFNPYIKEFSDIIKEINIKLLDIDDKTAYLIDELVISPIE